MKGSTARPFQPSSIPLLDQGINKRSVRIRNLLWASAPTVSSKGTGYLAIIHLATLFLTLRHCLRTAGRQKRIPHCAYQPIGQQRVVLDSLIRRCEDDLAVLTQAPSPLFIGQNRSRLLVTRAVPVTPAISVIRGLADEPSFPSRQTPSHSPQ